MESTFSVLDAAEAQTRQHFMFSSSRDGSVSSDVVSAGLFLLAAYALLVEQNVALFSLAFFGFAFVYRPIRLELPWVG